jgi:hypothetical protein
MLKITELSVILRPGTELPSRLIMKKGEFVDGWDIVRPASARRLGKAIQRCGWHSIRIAGESLRSGVGESSALAIVCALKLALRSFSKYFNAAEVRDIRVTTYPWFVIARLAVRPYRIQLGPVQPIPDDALLLQIPARKRQLPVDTAWLSQYGRDMPMLREMLIQSESKTLSAQ